MEDTTIKIGGMSCMGCVSNITGVLNAINGVSKVTVTLEPGEAQVNYDPQLTSRLVLLNAIEDAGFDAE